MGTPAAPTNAILGTPQGRRRAHRRNPGSLVACLRWVLHPVKYGPSHLYNGPLDASCSDIMEGGPSALLKYGCTQHALADNPCLVMFNTSLITDTPKVHPSPGWHCVVLLGPTLAPAPWMDLPTGDPDNRQRLFPCLQLSPEQVVLEV